MTYRFCEHCKVQVIPQEANYCCEHCMLASEAAREAENT